MIIANKMDTLESFKDEAMIEHLQYVLWNFSLKYGSSLFYVSAQPSNNILKLAEYFAYIMLGKENNLLKVSLDDQLFIPAGYDKMEIL